MADKDDVWDLLQVPIGGKWQRRTSGIWSEALPSPADNSSPFKKQLLACYWALAKTKHLIMGHIKFPHDLNCSSPPGCYLTHSAIKLSLHCSTPSSNGVPEHILPVQGSSMKSPSAQVPIPATLPALSQPAPRASGEFPPIS